MLKLFLLGAVLSITAAQRRGSQSYSDYLSYDADPSSYPSSDRATYPSSERESYPSYDRPSSSYPKAKPTKNNSDPPPNYSGPSSGYPPPLKTEIYISPVSHFHSVSPPYSDPYSRGGPTYSTHTSQTFIASVHP